MNIDQNIIHKFPLDDFWEWIALKNNISIIRTSEAGGHVLRGRRLCPPTWPTYSDSLVISTGKNQQYLAVSINFCKLYANKNSTRLYMGLANLFISLRGL